MSLRYTIEEVSKNGAVDTRSEDYTQAELVIGRGSGSDILLVSTFVSLRHAKAVLQGETLSIEDLGSLSGLLVNERVVSRQQLKAGDKVTLGDVSLKVSKEKDVWIFTERRTPAMATDVDAQVQQDLKRLNLSNRLPSYALISALLTAIVAVWCFAMPFAGEQKDSWSSGPLSNKHAAFETNCETCHTAPFVPVGSEQCSTCHRMTDHTPLIKASHPLDQACTTCHIEHEGDQGLVVRQNSTCTSCHANIHGKVPEAKRADVPSFAKHPEFSVEVRPSIPGTGEIQRVRLSDRDKLIDNSNVKLNHELHLKGPLRTRDGGTRTLGCDSCHQLSTNGKDIKPITFASHCQSCHGLGFDERLPSSEVPHGNNADQIYTFLYAEYAKLLLSGKSDPKTQEAFRLRPGERSAEAPAEEFTRGFVEQESRNAEQILFTKTACQLCHEVQPRTDLPEAELTAQGRSRYTVLPPQVPEQWMKAAVFSHEAHDVVQCESCHAGVRKSTETKDVLLPKVDRCQNCHGDPGRKHFVSSDCTMCHSYHDKLPLEPVRQMRIEDLLVTQKGAPSSDG